MTALLKDGSESDFSNEEGANINFITPGENLVVNGDFSQGKTGWIWELSGAASAEWNVDNNISHFQLSSGGEVYYNVQLRQNGIPLIQGMRCSKKPDILRPKTVLDSLFAVYDIAPYPADSASPEKPRSGVPPHMSTEVFWNFRKNLFGIEDPLRCHSFDTSDLYPWIYKCKCREYSISPKRHFMIVRGKRTYTCDDCHSWRGFFCLQKQKR